MQDLIPEWPYAVNEVTSKWLVAGGTAHDGMSYGPPHAAISWGELGCPLVPRPYRTQFPDLLVPESIAFALGTSSLTLDELDDELRSHPSLRILPYWLHQELANHLSTLPVREDSTIIRSGTPHPWLIALPTSQRLRNALARHCTRNNVAEVSSLPTSIVDFLQIRGIGHKAVVEMLCVLESAELGYLPQAASPSRRSSHLTLSHLQFQAAIDEAVSRAISEQTPLVGYLKTLAGWALVETDARLLGEAVEAALARNDTPSVWQKLKDIQLGNLGETPKHPYDLIAAWIEELPEREKCVFENRLLGVKASTTLQDLANQWSVTRERVRQIEKRGRKRFSAFLAKTIAWPIKWRIETILSEIGVAAPYRQVQELLAARETQVDYSEFLLRWAGPYLKLGDWLVLKEAHATDPTCRICERVDENRFIDEAFAESELSTWGLRKSLHREWLMREEAVREVNGKLVLWEGSTADRLAVALADVGRPSTIESLMAYINEDKSSRTIANALSGDSRFVRVSLTEWALGSWGLSEYRTIAFSIRSLLANSTEPLNLDEVVDKIRRDTGASETSIRQCCSAPMFVVTNGYLSLRGDLGTFKYDSVSIGGTAGVFVLGEGRVALLIKVDEELMRGSGRSLPMSVGALLSVPVNRSLKFTDSDGISVTITFPETSFNGPTLGTLRPLAESAGAILGNYLTVILDLLDMSASARAASVHDATPSWALVELLTGIQHGSVLEGLAQAINCREGEVLTRLKARGDGEVAKLIPIQASDNRALDEALRGLEATIHNRQVHV